MADSRSIAGQVVVIVGASSGIGLATALEAARRGASVVMAARNERELNSWAETIRETGGSALPVVADVTDYAQVERLASRAVEEYGRIDTWVNVAAVFASAPFREMELDDFRQQMEVNFMGQVHGARAALPHLERTAGALVCVGSAYGVRAAPLVSAYCASKHALKGWLESLRVELAHEGSPVRVVHVLPSTINTPLYQKAKSGLGVEPMGIPPVYPPELVAEEIVRAAEGNARDIYVGGGAKALELGQRISPRLLDQVMLAVAFRLQRTDRPRPADAPNNLYAPLESDGGVRGNFTGITLPWSPYQTLARHPAAGLAVAGLLGLALARRAS